MLPYKQQMKVQRTQTSKLRLTDDQLQETLKILTYEFVNSVEKIASLHDENKVIPKQDIYSRILSILEVQQKSRSVLNVDDCVKMLQYSYEQGVKSKCFEKDFSFQSSVVHNNSISKLEESDLFGKKNSFSYSQETQRKIKQDILNNQRSSQTTQYNLQKQEIFDFVIAQSFQTSEKNQNMKIQETLSKEIILKLQASDNMKDQIQEEEDQVDRDQDDDYNQSCSDSSYQEDQLKPVIIEKSKSKIKKRKILYNKKKYRSYTDQERFIAVKEARLHGIQKTSRMLNIPKKNIMRWMKRNLCKERIRGRKPINPGMQQSLTNWISENILRSNYLTQTQIRRKARQLSKNRDFKASKGWLEKYFRRNQIICDALNRLLSKKRNNNTPRRQQTLVIR